MMQLASSHLHSRAHNLSFLFYRYTDDQSADINFAGVIGMPIQHQLALSATQDATYDVLYEDGDCVMTCNALQLTN